MDRRELVNDMKQTFKASFITRQQLANYMGIKDPHCVDKYLHGLERVNGKFYFVTDVASRLKERCVI